MYQPLQENKGITLIELLVALIISSLLVGAAYRSFIGQQKTYIVQEQVIDLQQNARVSINKMMDEIMMAGFGGLSRLTNVITPGPNTISFVGGGVTPILAGDSTPIKVSEINGNILTLGHNTQDKIQKDQFIFIECESFQVTANPQLDDPNKTVLTLDRPPFFNPVRQPVFQVEAVTYGLGTSGGKTWLQRNGENIVDNIEDLRFEYFDENGNESSSQPDKIRMVRVTLTAKTDAFDPDYKGDTGGYRKRTIAININIRNLGTTP